LSGSRVTQSLERGRKIGKCSYAEREKYERSKAFLKGIGRGGGASNCRRTSDGWELIGGDREKRVAERSKKDKKRATFNSKHVRES